VASSQVLLISVQCFTEQGHVYWCVLSVHPLNTENGQQVVLTA
jgi:hypothetical protein